MNSGFSSGFPSFMLPYLEKYRTIIFTAQASWVPMYIQIKVAVIHVFHSAIIEFAVYGLIVYAPRDKAPNNLSRHSDTGSLKNCRYKNAVKSFVLQWQ